MGEARREPGVREAMRSVDGRSRGEVGSQGERRRRADLQELGMKDGARRAN
jgi:hypothetical protein